MKKLVPFVSIVSLLLVTVPAFAANNSIGTQGTAAQQKLQASPSPADYQVQNQVKTQNEGEDLKIQTNTQEQENLGQNEEAPGQGVPKAISPRSETAIEHMSAVAQKVEELLTTKTIQGGIGQEVKTVAQEQKKAQDQIETELEKVDGRGGLLKILIGPDYKAIKNIQQVMEQNQLRIQTLLQLQTQLSNQGDISQVQETIQALIEQNTALQDRISVEEQSGSLLGWMFKFFAR
jgi:hypothetical protein